MKTKSTTTATDNKVTVKNAPGTKRTDTNSEKDSSTKAIKKSPAKL